MRSSLKRKGFTLVELMIVIVIIGILAAIIIPTVTDAIQKARVASDKADLRNMNMVVEQFKADELLFDIDCHAAYSAILYDGTYDLEASAKGYAYWFNTDTKRIEYHKIDEMLKIDEKLMSIGNSGNISYASADASTSNNRTEIGAIADDPKFIYIDQSNTRLSNTINRLRSLAEGKYSFDKLIEELKKDKEYSGLAEHYRTNYDPSKTIYITNNNIYVNQELNYNIVFQLGIKKIPELRNWSGNIRLLTESGENETSVSTIELPSTVRYVQEGFFDNYKQTDGKDKTILKVLSKRILFEGDGTGLPEYNGLKLSSASSAISMGQVDGIEYTNSFTGIEVWGKEEEGNEKKVIKNAQINEFGGLTNSLIKAESGELSYTNWKLGDNADKAYLIFSPIVKNPKGVNKLVIESSRYFGANFVGFSAMAYDAVGNVLQHCSNIGYITDIIVDKNNNTVTIPVLDNFKKLNDEGEYQFNLIVKYTNNEGTVTVVDTITEEGVVTFDDETLSGGIISIYYTGEFTIYNENKEQNFNESEQELKIFEKRIP